MPTKPIVIENSAGEVVGEQAPSPPDCRASLPTPTAEHDVSATDEIRPRKPPITAPLVVQSFHSTDMNSTGKLAEAAIAKAR